MERYRPLIGSLAMLSGVVGLVIAFSVPVNAEPRPDGTYEILTEPPGEPAVSGQQPERPPAKPAGERLVYEPYADAFVPAPADLKPALPRDYDVQHAASHEALKKLVATFAGNSGSYESGSPVRYMVETEVYDDLTKITIRMADDVKNRSDMILLIREDRPVEVQVGIHVDRLREKEDLLRN